MALVEVDETELEALKKGLGLLNTLATKPETRREFQKILKVVQPDIRTEDDIAAEYAAPVKTELDTLKTEFADYRKAQEEREAARSNEVTLASLSSKFDQLKKPAEQGGMAFTDEGIEKLKQHMVDTQTPDPFVAAAHYVSLNPPSKPDAAPAAWEPDSLNIRTNAVEHDLAGLFNNEDAWADKMAAQVINEMRGAVAA